MKKKTKILPILAALLAIAALFNLLGEKAPETARVAKTSAAALSLLPEETPALIEDTPVPEKADPPVQVEEPKTEAQIEPVQKATVPVGDSEAKAEEPLPAVVETASSIPEPVVPAARAFHASDFPAFTGEAYTVVNNNVPFFSTDEITGASVEYYSPLDSLGRCGMCYACIGQDIMPTEERGSIGSVKPTGWHTIKYDFVDGNYLYNRCHLIGYQLSGENANTSNLITGTR